MPRLRPPLDHARPDDRRRLTLPQRIAGLCHFSGNGFGRADERTRRPRPLLPEARLVIAIVIVIEIVIAISIDRTPVPARIQRNRRAPARRFQHK